MQLAWSEWLALAQCALGLNLTIYRLQHLVLLPIIIINAAATPNLPARRCGEGDDAPIEDHHRPLPLCGLGNDAQQSVLCFARVMAALV